MRAWYAGSVASTSDLSAHVQVAAVPTVERNDVGPEHTGARPGLTVPARGPVAVPAAVSPLSAPLLGAALRPAKVLAAFPTALYLALDRHEQVLPVLTRDALLLPTALRLASWSQDVAWGVVAGDEVQVGEGAVVLPGMSVRAVRRWRPARVDECPCRHRGRTRLEEVREVLAIAVGGAALRSLSADLTRATLAGDDVRPALHGMLGGGGGLTPSGDDAVCGVLLTLRGAGAAAHARAALHAATGDALSRTTSLSASLLGAAGEGYAILEVSRLVRAATAGRDAAVRACLPAVLGIGHSSGADLAAGVLGALDALDALAVCDPRPVLTPVLTPVLIPATDPATASSPAHPRPDVPTEGAPRG